MDSVNVPAYVGVILTGVAMLGALMLYIIRGEIAKATKYLQPRNGGEGWSDVHDKVTLIVERQGEIVSDVAYIRQRLDTHIDTHHKGA